MWYNGSIPDRHYIDVPGLRASAPQFRSRHAEHGGVVPDRVQAGAPSPRQVRLTADERPPAGGPEGKRGGQRVIPRERAELSAGRAPALAVLREAELAGEVIRGATAVRDNSARHGAPHRSPVSQRAVLVYGLVTAALA